MFVNLRSDHKLAAPRAFHVDARDVPECRDYAGARIRVLAGSLAGTAIIALNNRSRSTLKGDFTNLDIGKLIALQGGSVTPIEGQTTGNVDLSFNGTELKNASGTLNANISANAGTAERGLIPVNGQVRLTATNGLFNVDEACLLYTSPSPRD